MKTLSILQTIALLVLALIGLTYGMDAQAISVGF